MKEIDETIEKHGGWPGAFVTAKPASSKYKIEEALAVLYALALLHTWGKPAERRVFELGMMLMHNDAFRLRILKRNRLSTQIPNKPATVKIGRIDEFIGELVGSGALRLENQKNRQLVGLGEQAPAKSVLCNESVGVQAFEKATEAVQAISILNEQGESLDLYLGAEEYGPVEIAIS